MNLRRVLLVLAIVSLGQILVPQTQAAPVDTAVVHIGVDDAGAFGVSNIVTYLQGDARFSSVGNIDVDAGGVPTLAQLSAFDSILVVTDNRVGVLTGGGLGTQLGNILDDYVGAGGRAVISTFSGAVPGIGIDGDILGIAPHTPLGSLNANVGDGLLNVGTADFSHFTLEGVNSFDSTFGNQVAISGNGILIGEYNIGLPLILTTADDSVIFLNGFPGTQSDFSNGSDFGLVFANALAGPAVVPEPASLAIWSVLGLAGLGWRRRQRMSRA